MEVYLCLIWIDGAQRVLLWQSDPDRIVLDSEGFAVSFATPGDAHDAVTGRGWALGEEHPSRYELDAIEVWCKSSAVGGEWTELLNAWNLFLDLDVGEKLFRAADRRLLSSGTYDKVFHACNLPAMTAEGEHYIPRWSAAELAGLRQLLLLGLAELRAHLR